MPNHYLRNFFSFRFANSRKNTYIFNNKHKLGIYQIKLMKKRDRQQEYKQMNAFKKKRLEQLIKKPLPVAWQKIITENVPYSRCLPPGFQKIYHGLIRMFLEEKHFEGCDGLRITDEIRLTIAAQACILLLGQAVGSRKLDLYPKLSSILVYPHAYVAHRSQRFGLG
jgi:Mlc titration factor MtfA (ptsG expression regulator)